MVLVPVSNRNFVAVDYSSYRLIQNSKRFDEDIVSEIQSVCEKVAVQVKEQDCNGKDRILVMSYLTKFEDLYYL